MGCLAQDGRVFNVGRLGQQVEGQGRQGWLGNQVGAFLGRRFLQIEALVGNGRFGPVAVVVALAEMLASSEGHHAGLLPMGAAEFPHKLRQLRMGAGGIDNFANAAPRCHATARYRAVRHDRTIQRRTIQPIVVVV